MTILPPSNFSNSSSTASPSNLGIRVFCWIIILALVGLEVRANLKQSEDESPSATNTTQPAATTNVSDDSALPNALPSPGGNVAMQLAGKLAVAQHAWSKSGSSEAMAAAEHQLQSIAKTTPERMDVAIVEREIDTSEKSDPRFAELHSLASTPEDRADLAALLQIRASGVESLALHQRDGLLERHGWFGKLALVYGLPVDAPARHDLIASTHKALIVASAAAGLGIAVLVIGTLLMIVAIVLAANGHLRFRYRPAEPGSIYLEAFAIYMCSFIAVSLLLHFILAAPSLLGTFIALLCLLPITLAWPVIRGERWTDVRQQYGWHRGEGILTEMGAGIGTYLAFVPALLVSVLVMTVLIRIAALFNLPGSSPTHPVLNFLSGPPATLLGVYLLACVGAPLVEESMFRGALFNHLRGRHGWWISSLVVSLLFAAVHPQGWTVIPPLATLSLTFCAMREWRSSLIGSMTAHALNNGVVLTISVLMLR